MATHDNPNEQPWTNIEDFEAWERQLQPTQEVELPAQNMGLTGSIRYFAEMLVDAAVDHLSEQYYRAKGKAAQGVFGAFGRSLGNMAVFCSPGAWLAKKSSQDDKRNKH